MWILSDSGIFNTRNFTKIWCNEGKLMFVVNACTVSGEIEVLTSYPFEKQEDMVDDYNKICNGFAKEDFCVDLRNYYRDYKV